MQRTCCVSFYHHGGEYSNTAMGYSVFDAAAKRTRFLLRTALERATPAAGYNVGHANFAQAIFKRSFGSGEVEYGNCLKRASGLYRLVKHEHGLLEVQLRVPECGTLWDRNDEDGVIIEHREPLLVDLR